MKNIAFLASVALVAVGIASNANAGGMDLQSCPGATYVALKCGWTWHGEYVVKGFDIYYEGPPDSIEAPKGAPCLEALAELQAPNAGPGAWILTSAGNALTDTYILRRCEPIP
jgi:hypothetical protein